MGEQKTLRNALLGAVLTVILSFTAISPLLGGLLAGYLQREHPTSGLKVGAISGAIASLPFLLVIGLGVVTFVGGMVGSFGIPGGIELVIILFVMVPIAIVWNVGLGAVGGYAGGYLRGDSRPPTGESVPPNHAH